MAAEHVQAKIGYEFTDTGLLEFALRAAHRQDEQSPSCDGNRGLASLGICVIEMVHTLYIVVAEKGTKRDVTTRDHWFRTKTGRASVCANLGIDSFVSQSTRQQHERPSSTVLSNALTAIIGAIWLDLGAVNESTSNACDEIFRILSQMNNVIVDMVPTVQESNSTATGGDDGTHHSMPSDMSNSATLSQSSDRWDASMIHSSGESQHESLSCFNSSLPFPHDLEPDFGSAWTLEAEVYAQNTNFPWFDSRTNGDTSDGFGLPVLPTVAAQSNQRPQIDNGEMARSVSPSDVIEISQTVVESGSREHSHVHRGRPHNSSLHQRLVDEELEKLRSFPGSRRGDVEALLDHPRIAQLSTNSLHVGQLRLLYFGIGSCQSLIQCREILRIARTRPNASAYAIGHGPLLTERFRAIRLYDGQEALSVLIRRYHVVKLFETELEVLRQDNTMIVETASSFGTSHTRQAGNPILLQEAATMDRFLHKIEPNLTKGTPEFRKVREQLTQLRRLAKKLQILTKRYGFGILALIPCSPSYSDFAIADSMLVSIPEGVFAQFSELLYQNQGIVLDKFSKAVEPALTALADGKLGSARLFPIESTEISDLEGLPMGSQELLDLCLRGSPASPLDL